MKRSYNLRSSINKNIITYEYISATKISNYLMNDPLLDYLKEYQISDNDDPKNINPCKKNKQNQILPTKKNKNQIQNHINNSLDVSNTPSPMDTDNNTAIVNDDNVEYDINNMSFYDFIKNEGNKFEHIIYEHLEKNYNVKTIVSEYESVFDYNKVLETKYNMDIQMEIIFQGLLSSSKKKLFGCVDFLIRSDIFKKLFNEALPDYKVKKNGNIFLYEVVDVKHSTLNLASNERNVLNSGRFPAYKGQLFIYLELLNEMQKTNITEAYIFGKKYCYTQKGKTYRGLALFKKIGVVDFNNYDIQYYDKVNEAIKWNRRLKDDTISDKWCLFPNPNIRELYPNMKNIGTSHDNFKRKYSNIINEITSVYHCGYKQRNNCLDLDIKSWKDESCNAEKLGFKHNSKIGIQVDAILSINRNKMKLIDYGTLDNDKEWKECNDVNTLNFYIDFETVNGDYGKCNFYLDDDKDIYEKKTESFIFMVGIGYECPETDEWVYKPFYINKLDDDLEYNMIIDVNTYIQNICNQYEYSNHNLIHWTKAEINFMNKFYEKHNDDESLYVNLDFNFFDLHKIFYDNNIVVKNAFNFSLKSIGNSMKKNNMIDLEWESDKCSNGLNCMIQAIHLYSINNVNDKSFANIINYNEIDCKMMQVIHKYLLKQYK